VIYECRALVITGSSCLGIARDGREAGGQNKLVLVVPTSCSSRKMRHALRSHLNLLLGHLILYTICFGFYSSIGHEINRPLLPSSMGITAVASRMPKD